MHDGDALGAVCTHCDTEYQLTPGSGNDCPDCGFVDWEVV